MESTAMLEARRSPEGGFGPVLGAVSEPEPTALAGLALDDEAAAGWLEEVQSEDGSVGISAGSVFRDLTAPAVLAMRDPTSVATALSWILGSRARSEPATEALPHDPTLRGWGWTLETFGWAEPTAWAVLALRMLGSQGPELDDGLAVLRDRECVGGGWNYGNRVVLDEELPPFVQPTALVLLALHGLDEPMVLRGLDRLASSWYAESDGLLSLATATATLHRFEHPEATEARRQLERRLEVVDPREPDTIALAWAVIAMGAGVERLAVR